MNLLYKALWVLWKSSYIKVLYKSIYQNNIMLLVQNNQYVRQKKNNPWLFTFTLSSKKWNSIYHISFHEHHPTSLHHWWWNRGGWDHLQQKRRQLSLCCRSQCHLHHDHGTIGKHYRTKKTLQNKKKHYRARQDIRIFENHGLTANIIPTNIKNLTRVLLLVLLGKLMET